MVGEVFPLAVRGQASALATVTNFASNFGVRAAPPLPLAPLKLHCQLHQFRATYGQPRKPRCRMHTLVTYIPMRQLGLPACR